MIDVDVIKSLRNEEEFVNYFKDKGLKLKQEEIENLINNKKGNEINICQLDKVVGGINFVKNSFFTFRELENRFVPISDWKPHVSLNGVRIKDEHVRALFVQTSGLTDLLLHYKDKLQRKEKKEREEALVPIGMSVAGFVNVNSEIKQVDEMLNCCSEHKALNTEIIYKIFDKVYDAEGFAASLLKNIYSIPVSLRQELKQEKPESLQQEVRADGSAIYLNESVFARKNSMTEYTYYVGEVEHTAYFYTNEAKTSVFLFRDNKLLKVTHRDGNTMLVRDYFEQTLYFIPPDSSSPLCEAKLKDGKVLYKFSGQEYENSLPAKVIVPKDEPKKEKTPSLVRELSLGENGKNSEKLSIHDEPQKDELTQQRIRQIIKNSPWLMEKITQSGFDLQKINEMISGSDEDKIKAIREYPFLLPLFQQD